MTTEPYSSTRTSTVFSRQLSRAGHGVLALFLVSVISSGLPPRLLEPAWQLQLSGTLIANGTIALLGLLLINLASWLNPDQQGLRSRQELLRRLAIVAVLGYLLLIPLQASALWRGLNQLSARLEGQRSQAKSRLDAIAKVVAAAKTPEDLQQGLGQIPGAPAIPSEQLRVPMPELRRRLNTALDTARARVRAVESGPNSNTMQRLVQESLRISFSALALAFAFAACAQGRGWNPGISLLDNLEERLKNPFARRPFNRPNPGLWGQGKGM